MGPIWGRKDPDGPHVGPRNFAIWELSQNGGVALINGNPVNYSLSNHFTHLSYQLCNSHWGQWCIVRYNFEIVILCHITYNWMKIVLHRSIVWPSISIKCNMLKPTNSNITMFWLYHILWRSPGRSLFIDSLILVHDCLVEYIKCHLYKSTLALALNRVYMQEHETATTSTMIYQLRVWYIKNNISALYTSVHNSVHDKIMPPKLHLKFCLVGDDSVVKDVVYLIAIHRVVHKLNVRSLYTSFQRWKHYILLTICKYIFLL